VTLGISSDIPWITIEISVKQSSYPNAQIFSTYRERTDTVNLLQASIVIVHTVCLVASLEICKVKVKLSLCLIKHHTTKAYVGMEV
jgi:hypothetical protein